MAVPENTKVRAVKDGTVTSCINSSSYGVKLNFTTDDGYDVFYAHLSSILVKEGERVTAGQVVALSGNTGITTGPHLHYGIHKNDDKIDPIQYVSLEVADNAFD
ncbi:M23 family metallopeptidase [Lachnospiraceae bacterium NSJ-143]|nr:M23 family metallopeptidase [Lachnospiraceae bacterium NSJ-143]